MRVHLIVYVFLLIISLAIFFSGLFAVGHNYFKTKDLKKKNETECTVLSSNIQKK